MQNPPRESKRPLVRRMFSRTPAPIPAPSAPVSSPKPMSSASPQARRASHARQLPTPPATGSRYAAPDSADPRSAARRAALQAVGLLPPDEAKPLSAHEREEERRLPPLPPKDTHESGRSAAQQLMEEWKAKNGEERAGPEENTTFSTPPRRPRPSKAPPAPVSTNSHSSVPSVPSLAASPRSSDESAPPTTPTSPRFPPSGAASPAIAEDERRRFSEFGERQRYSQWEDERRRFSQVESQPKSRRSVFQTLKASFSPRKSGTFGTSGNPRPPPSAMRAPLEPTIHNRRSIVEETGAIEDEESRRLSEMAFMDC